MESIDIKIKGVEFEVEYSYSPAEQEVRYDHNLTGHPASDEEVEIISIQHKETDFTEFFEEDWEMLQNKVLKQIHEQAEAI